MPYAIFTNYSGITPSDTGAFATKVEALERWIQHLEAERATNAFNLSRARKQLRAERRKEKP